MIIMELPLKLNDEQLATELGRLLSKLEESRKETGPKRSIILTQVEQGLLEGALAYCQNVLTGKYSQRGANGPRTISSEESNQQ
jgi:hypothetical protein